MLPCVFHIPWSRSRTRKVMPIKAKVKAISEFPIPDGKKQLMRFLGMAGYYRKFCSNFSTVEEPLTNLLRKRNKFIWSERCQQSFDKLKAILISLPVLKAHDFLIVVSNQLWMQAISAPVQCTLKKMKMVLIIQCVTSQKSSVRAK